MQKGDRRETYYLSDGYFHQILTDYFEKLGWHRADHPQKATLHHANFSNCSTCLFTNGLSDPDPINDKVRIHENLRAYWKRKRVGAPPFVLPFYGINQNEGWKLEGAFDGKTHWIIKPSDGLRQKGIKITKDFREFIVHLSHHIDYPNWLVQRYVTEPLLYKGRKFHFRCYALIKIRNHPTGPQLQLYVYPKGYMYVADKPYRGDRFEDEGIHITTSCNNQEFPGKYDEYFSRRGSGTFDQVMFPQIKDIVYHTIKACDGKLSCPNDRVVDGCCYKMLGYDLMADVSNRLYLLEVNCKTIGMASHDLDGNCKSKNPSLQTPEFKEQLMSDIMNIVIFDRPTHFVRLI